MRSQNTKARQGVTVTLGTMATLLTGIVPARAQGDGEMTPLPVLSLRDVGEALPAVAAIQRMDLAADRVGRFRLVMDDVVVTVRGATVRAAVVGGEHAGVILGQNLVAVRLDGRLLPTLLAAYLRLPGVQATLLGSRKAASVPGLTVGDLARLEVAIPPIGRQGELERLVGLTAAHSDAVARAAAARAAACAGFVRRALDPNGGSDP